MSNSRGSIAYLVMDLSKAEFTNAVGDDEAASRFQEELAASVPSVVSSRIIGFGPGSFFNVSAACEYECA